MTTSEVAIEGESLSVGDSSSMHIECSNCNAVYGSPGDTAAKLKLLYTNKRLVGAWKAERGIV